MQIIVHHFFRLHIILENGKTAVWLHNPWLVGPAFLLDEHVSTQETHALQNPDEHKEVRAEVVVLKISVRDPFHDQLGTQAGKT